MKPRSLVSLAAAVAASLTMIVLWSQLKADHEGDIANVAESVSYGTRSELVRRLETQFSALRRVALYWATYGGDDAFAVPRLASDAKIELDHFEGVEFLAWRYPNRLLRFFTEARSLDLTREPTDEEWSQVERALEIVGDADRETLVGPEIDDEGVARYVLYVPVSVGDDRAGLIASINVAENLNALLLDEAPGYSIRVTCCDGVELYERGEPAADAADSLIRDGWIELSPGALWNVAHAPTEALLEDLDPWALDALLPVGLLVSLLVGAFLHETLRARSRARAAVDAQAQVRAVNATLESEVRQRTQGLSEALADLNTINLSVSHDLRSPLQAIVALTSVVQAEHGDKLGERGAERLQRILANTAYMNGFLDRVLSFSQASSLECRKDTIDMREVAAQVADELAGNGAPAEIVVGELPPCTADARMIHILLANLVDNALKYADKGTGTPRIEIGCSSYRSETVYYVRDNGPGFDQADADRLFEPLERLEAGTRAQGLGLGLAIVKRIVERHGGRVWAESSPGQGATFSFTLPGRLPLLAAADRNGPGGAAKKSGQHGRIRAAPMSAEGDGAG